MSEVWATSVRGHEMTAERARGVAPESPVLLRHGQSVGNLGSRFTGWDGIDLTGEGRDEAHRAGRLLKEAILEEGPESFCGAARIEIRGARRPWRPGFRLAEIRARSQHLRRDPRPYLCLPVGFVVRSDLTVSCANIRLSKPPSLSKTCTSSKLW